MPLVDIENLPETILTTKKELKAALPKYREIFQDVEAEMRRRVSEIVKEREAGQPVIPIVQYADIEGGTVPEDLVSKIKRRGACVIRSTFSQEQATTWDQEIAHYVEENHLDAKLANAAEDRYFGTLASAKPQIYGIYWSRPQVQARQSETLSKVRIFLNHLWKAESEGVCHFNPNETPVYADRIRRRPPGSASLGLSPHTDGGSVERWLDENFRKVYRHVFAGDWKKYDAFDAAYRPEARRSRHRPSAPCSELSKVGQPSPGRVVATEHFSSFPLPNRWCISSCARCRTMSLTTSYVVLNRVAHSLSIPSITAFCWKLFLLSRRWRLETPYSGTPT